MIANSIPNRNERRLTMASHDTRQFVIQLAEQMERNGHLRRAGLLREQVAEFDRLREASRQMADAIKAWERWEADIILNDKAWRGGAVVYPTLRDGLWDRVIELQEIRNKAMELYKATG